MTSNRALSLRPSRVVPFLLLLLLASGTWTLSIAAEPTGHPAAAPSSNSTPSPDAPAEAQPQLSGFSGAVRTVGDDELHFLKYPFQKKAIKYDVLFAAATGALIASDEQVMRHVPQRWHSGGIIISNAALGVTALTAGGMLLVGGTTHNEHAKKTGIRAAEAAADSMILYGATKPIFARQRPNDGGGEGRFFAGNWRNSSFPSGHAMLTWTLASTVAHEYHSPWLKVLLYGLAAGESTTRVTSRVHYPSDVFVGSVLGYGIGAYVGGKDQYSKGHPGRIHRIERVVLEHVRIN